VEPIKWRVLNSNYSGKGKAKLIAENVLIKKYYDDSSNNYQYSDIRKWLNSNTGTSEKSDYNYSGGFLKTAFSVAERAKIVETEVDNSKSTCEVTDTGWNGYASETRTTDKIYLASVRDMESNLWKYLGDGDKDSGRIRETTDFADPNSNGGPDNWWLRSPHWLDDFWSSRVTRAGTIYQLRVYGSEEGVVPCLQVEN
jgi:hypothetical protein